MKKFKLFIGIDISKKWFDVALTVNGDRSSMLHRQFSNTKIGFKAMVKWIKSQMGYPSDQWLVCMEHTGVYVLQLCRYLSQIGIAYILESALRIHRSLGIKRGKSDKADAKDIAYYLEEKHKKLKISTLPSETLIQLQALNSQRDQFVKYKRGLLVAAKERYKADKQDYARKMLYEAKDIVALIDEKIKNIEKRIQQVIKDDPRIKRLYDLVTSVKGIGPVNAALFLIHTSAFTNFTDPRKYASNAGVAPFGQQSGTTVNKDPQVSPMANKKLKAMLTQAAHSAIKDDKEIRKYYRRKIDEGKNKFAVKNAVKNKLIHRVFAVVKRGSPYVELARYT